MTRACDTFHGVLREMLTMRKIQLCILFFLALTAVAVAQGQSSLEAIKTSAVEAWGKVNSMRAKVSSWSTVRIGDSSQEMRASGETMFMRENGREKYRQQIKLAGSKFSTPPSVCTLYDGDKLYEWVFPSGYAQFRKELECDLAKGPFWPGGALLFRLLDEQFTLTVKTGSTCQGRPAHVLEGVPKHAPPLAVWKKAVFMIDQALGVLVKVDLCDGNGVPVSVMELSELQINPDMDKNQFVPPAPVKTAPPKT